jgi:hypothetical protein
LIAAIVGTGLFYYVYRFDLTVLALSANTGFADFRDSAVSSRRTASCRGSRQRTPARTHRLRPDRLVGVPVVIFGGITDRLIPLFAVGAFLAFTLTGRHGRPLADGGGSGRAPAVIHGLGHRDRSPAWSWSQSCRRRKVMTLLIGPARGLAMVRRHYRAVAVEIANRSR